MPLETSTTISGLDESWPLGADSPSQGDDHLRLIKSVLKDQFPGAGGLGFAAPITATEAELNYSAGVIAPVQTQIDNTNTNIGLLQLQVDSLNAVEEAPIDGKRYGRQNGAWVPIKYIPVDTAAATFSIDSTNDMFYITATNASPISITINAAVAPYGDSVNIEKGVGAGDITFLAGVGVTVRTIDGGSNILSTEGQLATFVSLNATTWKMIV